MTDVTSLFQNHLDVMCQRADTAIGHAHVDRLAIYSGTEKIAFRDDWHYPFQPNPHFLSWVPLTEHPASWVIYEPGRKPQLIYYQPDDYWHQPPADPAGFWVDGFELTVIRQAQQARACLGNLATTALIAEDSLDDWAGWGFTHVNEVRLLTELEFHRAVKTPYELHCLRQAQRIAVGCHRAAEHAFLEGASEYDIHSAYLKAAGLLDGQLPYNSIVGLNEHAAVLHYQLRDREAPCESRSFLIDAGASYLGYAADITRTYSGQDDEFAALIEAMDDAQRRLCDQAKAGVDYSDIHLSAHHAIASLLQRFDLVRMEPDSIVDTGVSSTFLPHGIGHLIGLQVHDCGGFLAGADGGELPKPEGHPYLRLTRQLAPGFVVTIEPGLYFIPSLLERLRQGQFARAVNWDKVASFLPFGGVRVEDDIVVTEDQPENLTRQAFAVATGDSA